MKKSRLHPREKTIPKKKQITNNEDENSPVSETESNNLIISDEEFKELVTGILGNEYEVDADGLEQLKDSVRKHLKSRIIIN